MGQRENTPCRFFLPTVWSIQHVQMYGDGAVLGVGYTGLLHGTVDGTVDGTVRLWAAARSVWQAALDYGLDCGWRDCC